MAKPSILLHLFNEANDYQRALRQDAMAAAQRRGFTLEVESAGNDFVEQVRKIHACVHRPPELRPQFLMVFPVREGALEHVFRQALQAGIGCVVLNRRPAYMEALHRDFPLVPLATVGPSQTEAGRLQGRQVRAVCPGGGFVLQVHGPILSSATQERERGLQEELRALRYDTSVVYGDWRQDLARAAVAGWLRLVMITNLKVDAVASQNDSMAEGAKAAMAAAATELKRPELARVPVFGIDGQPETGQRLVNSGVLAGTVVQPSAGEPAIEWIGDHLDGRRPERDRVLPLTAYPDPARMSPEWGPRRG